MLAADDDCHVATLANGVRVVVVRETQAGTASVGLFLRSGSAHEDAVHSGIGHVVEHMVFKGTASRDARRINLDAERLGAEVNAHTDKDHTAFHMRGLAEHAVVQLQMLAELVQRPTFPAEELTRERAVLLQEFSEFEDDPLDAAFELFDRACFGLHPAAQRVIGSRRNIERFGRADLLDHVERHYTAANLVVGVVGAVDPDVMLREAENAFGAMRTGEPAVVDAPAYLGDLRTRHDDNASQGHLVLGFPLPSLRDDDAAGVVAAALLGEGMSSPLLDTLREQRGLAYHAACSADLFEMCGQFVVEASVAPAKLDEALAAAVQLLVAQADAVDEAELERARRQLAVRQLFEQRKPLRRLEDAALELFAIGHVRSRAQRLERLQAVSASMVRETFERMLGAGASLAITGAVTRGARDRARKLLEARGIAPARR